MCCFFRIMLIRKKKICLKSLDNDKGAPTKQGEALNTLYVSLQGLSMLKEHLWPNWSQAAFISSNQINILDYKILLTCLFFLVVCILSKNLASKYKAHIACNKKMVVSPVIKIFAPKHAWPFIQTHPVKRENACLALQCLKEQDYLLQFFLIYSIP